MKTERIICADCGAEIPKPVNSCGTGYAVFRDGRKVCYACADKIQREDLHDRSRPMTGYLSSDGQRWTTWTGGTLGNVIRLTESRCAFHGARMVHIRVRDVHGKEWYGRGAGPSMVLNLRPTKR